MPFSVLNYIADPRTESYISEETGEVVTSRGQWQQSPLHTAVLTMDPTHLHELLEAGECVNVVHRNMTPLSMAARCGYDELVEILLEAQANSNYSSTLTGYTPLLSAACAGNIRAIKMLLEHGALLNHRDGSGVNALWWATQYGITDVMRFLIDRGIEVDTSNGLGLTPLLVAVLNGNFEAAKILVEANCEINKADSTGCSPLYHSVKSGQRELSKFLVERGACVNQANQSGDRPIHVAALHGNVFLIQLLTQNGTCDVNVPARCGTPMQAATHRQHARAVEVLIAAGAYLNCRIISDDFRPPLIEAILHDKPRIMVVRLLIQGGVDVDISYKEISLSHLTPLECAVSKGHTDIIEMLVAAECAKPDGFHMDVHEHHKLPKEHINLITEHFCQPLTLKRSCRRALRKDLGIGGNYAKKIGQLGLPKPLQRFLTFEEIIHYGQCMYMKENGQQIDPSTGTQKNLGAVGGLW